MSRIDTSNGAIKLAKAIARDLLIHNEDKVVAGIQNDTFFDVLKKELEEGRTLYNSRVSEDILKKFNYYDRAIVDEIIKTKGLYINSKIW